MRTTKQYDLLETVAAISGDIHGDSRYPEFYERRREGCTEVWRIVVEAAQAFARAERTQFAATGRKFEYITAIEMYVNRLFEMDADVGCLTSSEMENTAMQCIVANV